jgi:hypothetical protein
VLFLGFLCGFLDCAFTSAVAGEGQQVYYPGRNLRLILRSCFNWVVCFLAGPVVFFGAALFYWLYGGDLDLLDWFIIAELVVVSFAYWLLALVAANRRDRLLDATPEGIATLLDHLGWRLLAVAVGAGAVALAHGKLAILAMEELHRNTFQGGCWLFLSSASGLFLATFLFRLLGIWCYRCQTWEQDSTA